MAEKKMTEGQKKVLANYTCSILDKYESFDEFLDGHGIPKNQIDKMKKAFQLISEVNQDCFK